MSGGRRGSAGLVVATPDGRLSRYLYGAEFAPRDLKLALVEAARAPAASTDGSEEAVALCEKAWAYLMRDF